ncbi:transcriptional regulator [Campylobacter devanensis]|uniref:transcriptional regulator n=1 Tax=Campylobacter devanensis TaxID=3161138 RepID=UPI000A332FB4|nr:MULTISPECIES: transcriptional regulator [unclassified Campylobacter]
MSKSLPNLRLNSPITSKVIGQNVAKVRKERKVSQLSLSLDMGYKSVSVVSFAEISLKGAHFNIAHLLQISTILNVPLIEQLSN